MSRHRRPNLTKYTFGILGQRVPRESQDVPAGVHQDVLSFRVAPVPLRVAVPGPAVDLDGDALGVEHHVDFVTAAPRVGTPPDQAGST